MRDMLIDLLWCIGREYDEYCDDSHEVGLSPMESFEEMAADHLLANGVTVQAHGHWVETKREWDFDPFYYTDYQCSVCGMREQDKSPFCRWCGTQMQDERSNENAE